MIRLDVGLPRSAWTFIGCLLPVFLLANLALLMISVAFIRMDNDLGKGFGVPFLAFSVIGTIAFAVMLARFYGRSFSLDGRVLIRRSVMGRKSYDLSVASVRAESVAPPLSTRPLPRLVFEQPGLPTVKLWLREPARKAALLPREQLLALAAAIDPGGRHPVSRALLSLANDPLGGAR